jgi:hypothetical protein
MRGMVLEPMRKKQLFGLGTLSTMCGQGRSSSPLGYGCGTERPRWPGTVGARSLFLFFIDAIGPSASALR